MARPDLLVGLQSFQELLIPLFEVETTLCRLRDTHFQLTGLANAVEDLHPEACAALRAACASLRVAISHFREQQWYLVLAFRAELQNINRATGSLPTIDVTDQYGG
eukprot:s1937_g18.t1